MNRDRPGLSRRSVLLTIATATGGVVLAACGSAPPAGAPAGDGTPAAGRPAGRRPVNLRYWQYNVEVQDVERKLVETYARKTPGATIRYEAIPWQ
ncbi:MAG TPA: hypothetical protein VHS99_23620, partial [Chloroflexota bacterium]|nr:hypothetical protein [Chloroflexota bacterium]